MVTSLEKDIPDKKERERYERVVKQVLKKYPTVSYFLQKRGFLKRSSRAWRDTLLYVISNRFVKKYLDICWTLRLDPFDLYPMETLNENRKEMLLENRMLQKYFALNLQGRRKFWEYLNDLCQMERYLRI